MLDRKELRALLEAFLTGIDKIDGGCLYCQHQFTNVANEALKPYGLQFVESGDDSMGGSREGHHDFEVVELAT